MKEITLQNGITVTVYTVPPFALTAVEAAHPVPEDDGTPEGHTRLREALQTRERVGIETAWLIALPDVVVPENWVFPDALRYAGVNPRSGPIGRKLDYIEYALLRSRNDLNAVQAAMYEMIGEDEVHAAEATFRVADGGDASTSDTSA